MNISQDVMSHPLFKQVTADIEQSRAAQQTQRMLDQAEAQRVRGDVVRGVLEQYRTAVDEYERARKEAHAALHRVWDAVLSYSVLSGGQTPPTFPARVFNEISVPSLLPDPSPWNMPNGMTTTQAAIHGHQASMGKTWPAA